MNPQSVPVDFVITFVYPAVIGFVYGYLVFGSPFMRRHDVASFLGPGAMAGIVFLLCRNLTSPRGTPLHILAFMLYVGMIWLGTILRGFVDERFARKPPCQ